MSARPWRATLVAAIVAALLPAAGAAQQPLEVAPVQRLPFPERGYVVRLPDAARVDASTIEVRENGAPVRDIRVSPVGASGVRFGVVLAIDASESMAGAPAAAALEAARAFIDQRDPNAEVGLLTFNGDVAVIQPLTRDDAALAAALREAPGLAYGTRINDGLARSLEMLRRARVAAGSIVVLSDGADVGSVQGLEEVVSAAERQRVRVFAVALRSGAFDGSALRLMAQRTGGSYAEARSAGELAPIYEELGRRLASEYLVRYRSDARPESRVDVRISVAGVGRAVTEYVAPTPSGVDPYHRSLVARFVLSPASVAAVGLLSAALVGWALLLVVRGPKRDVVARIAQFSDGVRPRAAPEPPAGGERAAARYTRGWWALIERDLELARIDMSPRRLVVATAAASLVLVALLVRVSPVLALVGLVAPPLLARAIVRWKLKRLRDEFADQLPTCLQVLASALRAGHSFSGALGVVVENAHEPARSELRRVVHDDKLGVAPDVALRRMGERMDNRDVEQVALLAELQRTAGGNSAEVLDTVVETIRQRGELRRLVRTLTAQGRMARWILTALPIVLTGFLWFMHPDLMGAFFGSGGGQLALAVAIAMVAAGSVAIQRIIDIDV